MSKPIGFRVTIDLVDIGGYTNRREAIGECIQSMLDNREGSWYCTDVSYTDIVAAMSSAEAAWWEHRG